MVKYGGAGSSGDIHQACIIIKTRCCCACRRYELRIESQFDSAACRSRVCSYKMNDDNRR